MNRLARRSPAHTALLAALVTSAAPAAAQVSVRSLARAFAAGSDTGMWTRDSAVSAIVELPDGEDAAAWGLPRIGSRFTVVRGPLADLAALASAHPTWRLSWSPSLLHPLLDRAAGWVHAPTFRESTGLTGRGVLVGIIDTGVDCTHPDLRNADGSTRIEYLIDFGTNGHGAGSAASQTVLDAEAQCRSAKIACAVRDRVEIDAELAENGGAALPTDSIGHGTHVASLAAGNGGSEQKYVGIAPEASIVAVRALDSNGDLTDTAVLLGAQLAFSLAEHAGPNGAAMPLVINLSLGSNVGPHDGTSAPLESGLSELVGDDHPGRAIVVAAGNSAGLVATSAGSPGRLGVHTDVNVPERTRVRVPIAILPTAQGITDLDAGIEAYIAFRPGDDLDVGLDRNGAEWVASTPPGSARGFGSKETLAVAVFNGEAPDDPERRVNGAAIVVRGKFSTTDEFAITFEGHGTASLWIQSEGDLRDTGALFRGATREGTVTLPATSPAVISVGATLSRDEWRDRAGGDDRIVSFGSVKNPPLDTVAYFSSAGPTSDSRLKPDLVAPGGFVVGAMSRDADPKHSALSVFGETDCEPSTDCAVVDATHAVATGTSMAAPIVAGAVALLLEEDPTLTTDAIRALLQAGARRPTGAVPATLTATYSAQSGAGVLDLDGIRDVKDLAGGARKPPSPAQSWLTLGATYAHPDPGFPVPAVLKLKDEGGRAAVSDEDSLELDVEHGSITSGPFFDAPGLVRFSVAASRDTGGDTLRVAARHQGDEVASAELPIAVDVNVLREGFFAHGGCALSRERSGRGTSPLLAAAAVLGLLGARRRRPSARRH